MKLTGAIVLAAILVAVSADCGCLKCGKHLKIVSPPGAPVTVIERGEACVCEKPIPCRIEVPHIVPKHIPSKSYEYMVHRINFVKPDDPVLCQHGFKVEVPYIQSTPPHYYQGLIAKTDRVVMPAKDECPPPKPTYEYGPIFEYYCPKNVCRTPSRPTHCRRKRDAYSKNRIPDFRGKDICREPVVDWIKLLEPKNIGVAHARNPWKTQIIETPKKITPLERLKTDLKEKIDKRCHQQEDRTLKRNIVQDKPFRITIPLNPRKRFFLDKKNKGKYKPPTSHEERYQSGVEINPSSAQENKPLRSKTLSRLIEKSGKFADPEDVEISLPTPQKAKIAHPFKTRKARSITLEDKTFPYYKLTRPSSKRSKQSDEGSSEDSLDTDERVEMRRRFLKPFDVETVVPENQAFYLMNTPIRMLNHIHKMREHVSPMVRSVPDVLDTSAGYFLNFGKRFRRGAMDFFKELFGNIKKFPGRVFRSFLKPTKREKRNVETTRLDEDNSSDPKGLTSETIERNSLNQHRHKLSKRAIVKLVPDDDIHEFLREKLSIFASSEEEDSDSNSEEDTLLPVTPKRKKSKHKNQNRIWKNGGELVMERITPKLVLDKGNPYLDIDGRKKPLVPKKRRISKASDDIQETIGDIIEEARLMAANPRGTKREYESDMLVHIIKTKISDTLDNIQDLIEQDFDRYETIYAELLKLQRLKESAVDEWKYILINKKHNDSNSKINLLNKFNEMLSLKDEIVELIGEALADGRSSNTNSLVKKLIRLQKLHCILVKIVESFAGNIKFQTPNDIAKQIKQVDFLAMLDLISEKTLAEISVSLQKERDDEVEKQVEMLDNLKNLLDAELSTAKDDGMDQVAKLLWEIGNCEKIQADTVSEMNEKIGYKLRIRRELKIIFDLEKQIETCRQKLESLFRDVSKRKGMKPNNFKTKLATKAPDKLSRKKPVLKMKSPKKSLRL